MKSLIMIGYWNDLVDNFDFLWPQELVSERPHPNREKVSEYLSKGKICARYKGRSRCRICKKLLGSCEQTDGVYVWPENLDHYVLEHNVVLPDEFIAHVEGNGLNSPKIQDEDGLSVNFLWWIDWCQRHRNFDLQQSVRETSCYSALPRDFEINPSVMNHLFALIEKCDSPVIKIEMDYLQRLVKFENVVDNDGIGKDLHLWGALLTSGNRNGVVSLMSGYRKNHSHPSCLNLGIVLASVDGDPAVVVSRFDSYEDDDIGGMKVYLCESIIDEKDFYSIGDTDCPRIHHQIVEDDVS